MSYMLTRLTPFVVILYKAQEVDRFMAVKCKERKVLKFLIFLFALLQAACGAVSYDMSLRQTDSYQTSGAVSALIEEYLTAETPELMRQAVKKMEESYPETGAMGILGRELAYFDDLQMESVLILLEGCRDATSPYALLNLHKLWEQSWTFEERRKAEILFEEVARHHASFEARAFANYILSKLYRDRGRLNDAASAAARNGWRIPFAILGSFDNEQGKGFNIVFPPEEKIDLKAVYPGKNVKIGWRTEVPLGLQNEIDFTELLYPNEWAVAFGASAFQSDRDGEYELRISTTDALKVWFNGALVFSERKIDAWSFDTFVIPVTVKKGANQILVKTVQNNDSSWRLLARLTEKEARPVAEGTFSEMPADIRISAGGETAATPLSGADIVWNKVAKFEEGTALRLYLAYRWAELMGLERVMLEIARQYHEAFPKSPRGKFNLMMALWENGERSRASDLLGELVQSYGDDFVVLKLKQARFWIQEDLEKKAWQLLLDLTGRYPDRLQAFRMLANWYESKRWTEERCLVLEEVTRKRPKWQSAMYDLADCYEELNLWNKEMAIYEQILGELPYSWSALYEIHQYALNAQDFGTARRALLKMIEGWPDAGYPLRKLGDLERRAGRPEEARAVWKRLKALAPTSPLPYDELAKLAYLEGNTAEAVLLWKEALERDPDRQGLVERLSYLEPATVEIFSSDIPTNEEIDAAIKSRRSAEPLAGADTLFLLDHMVTELKNDGSTVSVATNVTHSLNVTGRDAIMDQEIGCPGMTKVLKAYSISPSGKMSEASSIGASKIKFRGLEVGSTTVVQSRCERSPDSLIGDYYSFNWSFQRPNMQFVDSEFVLWLPQDVELKEWFQGEVKRKETEQKQHRRISWHATNTPVFKMEPSMPHPSETVWRLSLSTVPDWSMFQKWEEALVDDAFRKSPEVEALAKKLFGGLSDPLDKLNKIQAFLATDIRYQIDYENTIAGVKPHPAPVILARGYGDCKDKSVLFIVLAELGGIKADLALLRTTKYGVITREVPYQQFNHAIVYVPAQAGISESRFYDPTADGLDVDVLRSDDAGAMAFVLDGREGKYKWIEIPFQSESMNRERTDVEMALNADGSVSGKIAFYFKGLFSASIRKVARNSELFAKFLQVVGARIIPGSKIVGHEKGELSDIMKPVELSISYRNDHFATKRDNTLHFSVPFVLEVENIFALETREHPLLLGVPNMYEWNAEIDLPQQSKVRRAPENFQIKMKCLEFSRRGIVKKGKIKVEQSLKFLCDRIEPNVYPEYRLAIQKMSKVLGEEIAVDVCSRASGCK